MSDLVNSFPESFKMIFKDPLNFILFLIPVLVGLVLYAAFGAWVFSMATDWGQKFISQYITNHTTSKFLYYILSGLMVFTIVVLANWTFVVIAGILASPFNDIISSRIERKMLGKSVSEQGSESFKLMLKRLGKIIINESKKIIVLGLLGLITFLVSFIPVLFPLVAFLYAILLAAQYLDYSWARHDLSVSACFNDVRKHLLTYTIGGGVFLMVVSVPFINVMVPTIATSFFTVLWVKKNKSNQVSKKQA